MKVGKGKVLIEGFVAKHKVSGVHKTTKNYSIFFETERGLKASLSFYGENHDDWEISPVSIVKTEDL